MRAKTMHKIYIYIYIYIYINIWNDVVLESAL